MRMLLTALIVALVTTAANWLRAWASKRGTRTSPDRIRTRLGLLAGPEGPAKKLPLTDAVHGSGTTSPITSSAETTSMRPVASRTR